MAEVCTPTLEGTSSIATRPLNLTLLSKKRSLDDELYRNEISEEEEHKRRKLEDEKSDSEEHLEVVDDDPPKQYEENSSEDGDKSKSSILRHFYSFIRRKNDEVDIGNPQPKEDTPKDGERQQKSPASMEEEKALECDRITQQKAAQHLNGQSPPITPPAMLDYNAAFSRHLAATRAGPPNIMDIWSAVAANALARAKCNTRELTRTPTTLPGLMGLGNDFEQKGGFTGSPIATNAIPERTMRQNNWAVKVWRDWAIERNSHANLSGKTGPFEIVPLDIKDASVELMSYWLPRFITEVRRRDKRPYPPDTLMQIASGLQRHLRHVSGRSDITFFDKYSPTFAEFREALKARSDAINNELSTARREMNHHASPQGNDAGEQWSSSLFNLNTAKGLFRAIFYYNCVNFHITSMEEHHSLLVSQFHVAFDEKTGQEYLEFRRDNGEVTRKFATSYDPRCIVKVYKKYFKCIPSTGLLYKRPLQSTDGTELRFSFNPVGINKLRETFKILFGGRRTGAHLPAIEDDDINEGRSPTTLRYHSGDDDSRRTIKFNHSPVSNASSGRASLGEDEYNEENRRPSDGGSPSAMSPGRTVIAYAPEAKPTTTENDIKSTKAKNILEENNNNNSSPGNEDENCLTLKVPSYVKKVVILQGNRRFQVDLTAMN